MADEDTENKYVKCSRCRMKYHNNNDDINEYFGYNRLGERFKTCVKCKQYKIDNREWILQHGREYS
jgi:hypothetical protein